MSFFFTEVFDGQCCTNVTTDCFSNGSIDGSITSDSGVGCWSAGGSLLFANAIGIDLGGMLEVVTKNSDCSETTDYVPVFDDVSYTWTISGPDSTNGVGPVASLLTTKAGEYIATFYMDATNRLCPPETFIASTDLAIVKVDSIDVWDGDDRYAADDPLTLEVVGDPFDGITGLATPSPANLQFPDGCPIWTLDGADEQFGAVCGYSVNAGVLPSTVGLVLAMGWKTHELAVQDLACEIVAYPSGHASLSFDFGKYVDPVKAVLDKVGGDDGTAFQFLEGKASFENWWEEIPDNNKVMFCFVGNTGFDPLVGASGEWPICGIPLPKVVRKYADAGIYLTMAGKFTLVGGGHREVDSCGAQGGFGGSIMLGVSGKIKAKGVVDVSVSGTSGITCKGDFIVDNVGFGVAPSIAVGGLSVDIGVTVFNGKVEIQRNWTPIEPATLYDPGKVYIIEWDGR